MNTVNYWLMFLLLLTKLFILGPLEALFTYTGHRKLPTLKPLHVWLALNVYGKGWREIMGATTKVSTYFANITFKKLGGKSGI